MLPGILRRFDLLCDRMAAGLALALTFIAMRFVVIIPVPDTTSGWADRIC
jgi:hypothetical protein